MKTKNLSLWQLIASCWMFILMSFPNDSQAVTIKVNEVVPEITLPNQTEQNISLSSLKGKKVLVYFWVSWNPTARMNNTSIRQLHKKYQNAQFKNASGFELFAISLDSEKDQWIKAIQEDNLSGIHVNDVFSKYAAIYQIETLPASFLIDEKGKVVEKDMTVSALDKYLEDKATSLENLQQQDFDTNTSPQPSSPLYSTQPSISTPISFWDTKLAKLFAILLVVVVVAFLGYVTA